MTRGKVALSDPAKTAASLVSLLKSGSVCQCSEWPGELNRIDDAGLYAWWVDTAGAKQISERLGCTVATGIVYAGQAGASPSQATLRSRITDNHVRGKIRNSTFRLTLAAILLDELLQYHRGDRNIGVEGERIVSDWMKKHLAVSAVPYSDRSNLAAVEDVVLALLDPPLNLDGMPTSESRAALRKWRSILRHSPEPGLRSLSNQQPPQGRPTLHEEIAEVLREKDNCWMTCGELASKVNQRGKYRKRNGTAVDAFQVHGRTRNYPNVFERAGQKVRLAGVSKSQ